jgi:hypothetical protein
VDPVTATAGWDAQGNPVSQPAAPPPSPQGWDAQGNPISAAATAPQRPQPAQDAITGSYAPQGGEGAYQMHDPAGIVRSVGYHQVHKALDDGFLFADKPTLQTYARDHAADPLDENRVDQWIDRHPIMSGPLRGIIGGARGLVKTATAFDRRPTTRAETEAQMFAATPARNLQEGLGEATEGLGEIYATGPLGAAGEMFKESELLGMLGRAGTTMKAADKFKTVTRLAQLIEEVPMIGKVLKIGASAAKNGTIAGAQTFVKTGGDVRASLTAAALGAAAVPVLQGAGAVASGVRTMVNAPGEAAAAEAAAAAARETTAAQNVAAAQQETAQQTAAREAQARQNVATTRQQAAGRLTAAEQQAAEAETAARRQELTSRAAYAGHARAAVEPALEQTNAARTNLARNVPQQEVMMNQPGGEPAAPTGRMVATATGKPVPAQINTPEILGQISDFTGAADHLTAINDDAYNQFDAATGGRFRQINGEVAAAQNAMRKGEQGAAAIYKQKLGEMDQLMDSTAGEMTPEMKAAAKAGFRQSYMLRDFGNLWDRNLNGVPGASKVSLTQRGINGRGLMTDLQRAVKLYGRPQIEASLGTGRLESLEEIAQQNVTDKGRAVFNNGLQTVTKEVQKILNENPEDAVAKEIKRLKGNEPAPPFDQAKAHAAEVQRLEEEAAKGKPPAPAAERLSPWAKRGAAFTVGATLGHMTGFGGFAGGVAGETTYETSRYVLNAIKTNPKIAQNFLFALQSGATAERYGPFIATMIQKAMTDSSLQRQQQERQR